MDRLIDYINQPIKTLFKTREFQIALQKGLCCVGGGGGTTYLLEGTNVTITGTGTDVDPYIISADTGLTNLTDNYVPVSDGSGLEDSMIYTDGAFTGIGTNNNLSSSILEVLDSIGIFTTGGAAMMTFTAGSPYDSIQTSNGGFLALNPLGNSVTIGDTTGFSNGTHSLHIYANGDTFYSTSELGMAAYLETGNASTDPTMSVIRNNTSAPIAEFLAIGNSVNILPTGNLEISALGGGGTMMVVTDNDGLLSTQAIPGGGGLSWTSPTNNYIGKYNTAGTDIINSTIVDDGTTVSVAAATVVARNKFQIGTSTATAALLPTRLSLGGEYYSGVAGEVGALKHIVYQNPSVSGVDFGFGFSGDGFSEISHPLGLAITGGLATTRTIQAFFKNDGTLGVNTGSTPDASAILHAASTTKGFLGPKGTTTNKNAISSPATGLGFYDTTINSPEFYNGSAWSGPWSKHGNAGTTAGTHFIGTTDNVSLDFRVNNTIFQRIYPNGAVATSELASCGGFWNLAFGYNASTSTSNHSIAIGTSSQSIALRSIAVGANSVALHTDAIVIGSGVGRNSSATGETSIDGYGGIRLYGASGSTMIGKDAGKALEINSTTGMFIPPIYTGAAAEALATKIESGMIYASDGSGATITSKGWWGWDGAAWNKLN